ncbi:tetratricopeptide (TPR) repeat protein [Flavobacterium nitrogenifigens]|uniref:Tetratricopeptide (TPR) repeat protein n=2 Tax=Flavobacterium TaxID=237 RepID=A0A7W7IVF6_9FLAO|nr:MULTISPECIES: tetratricopeptide repeat protein [Flavobacterium]MBB4801326.1 tetratricopeptide (TPR) repeat protein [Flavobacterium nitrogenifigens]MBB6384926.1 tetratricopeptide (TPR) repeat protein [Flavobacterium notoginsengisoli]
MNKFKIFSLALIASAAGANAQDINEAKKAIDAEQFDKAKTILKSIIKSKPSDGEANFVLGNVYLNQSVVDSAKIYYNNGLQASDKKNLSYIGLGQLDLDAKNTAAAQANFALATKDMRKKDVNEFIYIGRAYINSDNPDYKNAIAVLQKALAIDPQNAQALLAIGDAYYGDKNQNDAYKAYRDAFAADNTLLRAKMQLGVLLKGAKSYDEAIKSFNEVIALNANYGPVYRELAETYYKWARNKPSTAKVNLQNAITNYEKYLSLTDYSLDSKMRHADFLILVKDYKQLETVANKMIAQDKVNPRIYRYLGYAAYENGNVDVAIKSIEDFMKAPENKVIGRDYYYLGLAKIKKGTAADGTIDQAAFDAGLADIKKAIELEPLVVEEFADFGKELFSKKQYTQAASIFELGANNKESKNYLDDAVYYGISVYYGNAGKPAESRDKAALENANATFDKVLEASPSYDEAYLYKGRINSALDKDDMIIKNYEEYVTKVTAKGAEELAKPATTKKVIEAYNAIGAAYANTDKAKAIEYFNKTLVLDPANSYATQSVKSLK